MAEDKIPPSKLSIQRRSLKEILKLHAIWLDGKEGERAHLRGGSLADADLKNADFRQAILTGISFLDADLSGPK
jgi:uncharacterized protein YjbI with pentapeptide repeats